MVSKVTRERKRLVFMKIKVSFSILSKEQKVQIIKTDFEHFFLLICWVSVEFQLNFAYFRSIHTLNEKKCIVY